MTLLPPSPRNSKGAGSPAPMSLPRTRARVRSAALACGCQLADRAVVADRAVRGGILEQCADDVAPPLPAELEGVGIADHDVDAADGRARAYHRDRLRVTAGVHEVDQFPVALRHGFGQVHRFRRSRSLVGRW